MPHPQNPPATLSDEQLDAVGAAAPRQAELQPVDLRPRRRVPAQRVGYEADSDLEGNDW